MMTADRLDALLRRVAGVRIAVLGDFFVDKYLDIDPSLEEISLETGLPAHQVTGVRCLPGAAGTVTNNLAALGVQRIDAVGFSGDDGEGFQLRRGLAATGVDTAWLLTAPDRVTPTYTKPLRHRPGQPPEELSRLDIKNRDRTPRELEERLVAALVAAAAVADAVIVGDQVDEADCGVVTARLRTALADLGRARPELPILADSRRFVAAFSQVSVKPNRPEAAAATGLDPGTSDPATVALAVARRAGRPCFVTLGEAGVVVADGATATHVPGIAVPPPIDIVGAGDSFCAGAAAALAAGASWVEAAELGCLVASLTVQQLGTTGTATPDQVRHRHAEVTT